MRIEAYFDQALGAEEGQFLAYFMSMSPKDGGFSQDAGLVNQQVLRDAKVGPHDVICGRDSNAHSHPGNKEYKALIQSYRLRYQTAHRRDEKSHITAVVIEQVRAKGGRFLVLDNVFNDWTEADSKYVHEKVSHALRSAMDPSTKKVKRTRTVKVIPPTMEEQKDFEDLVECQQAILSSLREQADNSSDTEVSDDAESKGDDAVETAGSEGALPRHKTPRH